MKESVAVAELAAPPHDYYRWVEPDSHITVCLQPGVADRLQREAMRGVDFSSKAGVEAGGILLGRTERGAGRTLVFVEDFEPVPCEHRNGPAYAFATQDADAFGAALARRGLRQPLTPVGYYRSHNREGLFLSGDDLRIIHRHFRGPDNLFLLIKTLANRTCTAGFFFWKDARIQAEFTDSEVPLVPVSLAAGDLPEALPRLAPEPERRARGRLIPALAIGVAAAAFTFAVVRYERTEPAKDPSSRGPQQSVPSEVFRTAAPAPAAVPGEVPTSRGLARDTVATADMVRREPEGEPATPLREEPNQTASGSVPEGPPAAPPTVTTERVAEIASPLPPAATAPSPAPPPAPSPAIVSPAPENSVRPAIEAPPADAIARSRPAVVPPLPTAPVAPPAPVFTAARVIHKATPAIPRGVGPMITTDVQVDVAVAIDIFGKVTDARIAGTRGAAAGLLTIEALKAAQLFRFQPAQENGRAIPGSQVLTFRFARTTR